MLKIPDQLGSRGLGRSARPLPSAGLRETRKNVPDVGFCRTRTSLFLVAVTYCHGVNPVGLVGRLVGRGLELGWGAGRNVFDESP